MIVSYTILRRMPMTMKLKSNVDTWLKHIDILTQLVSSIKTFIGDAFIDISAYPNHVRIQINHRHENGMRNTENLKILV